VTEWNGNSKYQTLRTIKLVERDSMTSVSAPPSPALLEIHPITFRANLQCLHVVPAQT